MTSGIGGAAASLGIGFQHRVGALVLASMLAGVDPLVPFRLMGASREVEEVRFETDDKIDDLVLVTTGGRIFVQAKRSVDLSESPGSEFMAVIRQFVGQYLREPRAGDVYTLVTSPRASARVVTDLRKLTVASRLNALGGRANPLTASERRTLDVARRAITDAFRTLSGREISESEREEIFRRIHVISLAVEDGGDQERAVLTLLGARARVEPSLVWRDLIVLALDLAGRRSSIDRAGLLAHAGHMLGVPEKPEWADGPEFGYEGPCSAGLEVILAWQDDHLVLADIRRFDSTGARRLRFKDGAVELPDGAWLRLEYRASTFEGVHRFLKEPAGQSLVTGRRMRIVVSNLGPEIHDSVHARAQAERCRLAFESNPVPLFCLKCGRAISEISALHVEIDEEDLPYEVGLVHRACLQPAYRVLGIIACESFRAVPVLKDFDFQAWFAAIFGGQSVFAGLPEALRGRRTQMGWKPGRTDLSTARWCVSYQIGNGDVFFVRERGEVYRMTERQAREMVADLDREIAAATAEGDPICVSDRSEAFGNYSQLVLFDPTSAVHPVTRVEARVVSRAILQTQRTCDHYYAPLLALIDASTNKPLVVHGNRVLLTDPLRIGHYLQNWKMTGADYSAFDSVVIGSDAAFDRFVYSSLSESIDVLVDPIFAIDGSLVAGVTICDFREVLDSKARLRAESQDSASWPS